MEVLESNPTNFLVLRDDGEVEPVTRTDQNTLLFDHDLWGFLRDGTDILTLRGADSEPKVTLTPDDRARGFKAEVSDGRTAYLGEHWRTEVIAALVDYYEADDRSVEPLTTLIENALFRQIDPDEVAEMLGVEPFQSAVEERMGGWLINDHLLLSWEGDFYHPGTTSRTVSGSSVMEGSSDSAYEISGIAHGSDVEKFTMKAVWAVTEAPRSA